MRGEQKLNIGTIGTTADFKNKDMAWTTRRNPRKRKWKNSSSNHEAKRLRINIQKRWGTKDQFRHNKQRIHKQMRRIRSRSTDYKQAKLREVVSRSKCKALS